MRVALRHKQGGFSSAKAAKGGAHTAIVGQSSYLKSTSAVNQRAVHPEMQKHQRCNPQH
jgi:hypothetical protein